jgi:hypothetical protein
MIILAENPINNIIKIEAIIEYGKLVDREKLLFNK